MSCPGTFIGVDGLDGVAPSGPLTHGSSDWTMDALIAAKRYCSTSISVVIPAHNEAATVGDIVSRIRADLIDGTGLVDQLVVIDSDSEDETAAIARAAGAEVYAAGAVHSEFGHARGKGEAIWKSLFVTTGDVIVFLDADLIEWGTHFVAGLLGPLLTSGQIQLVKGFYDRPVQMSGTDGAGTGFDQAVSFDGGRVTELVARPLIAQRWPGLEGVIQPLAGEWAARRDVLSALSIPTGYGVDLAALIDVYRAHGLASIAQVDLGSRSHHHQSLRDLGLMALQLIAVTDRRAGITCTATDADRVVLQQFMPGPDRTRSVRRTVCLAERPPAADAISDSSRTA